MVFQSYALYPHMSVESNIGFALRMAREEKGGDPRRVWAPPRGGSASTSCCTGGRAQLSGGQRQRVALGRAIVR